MAVQGRSILGIDFSSSEINVVEMRGNWPEGQINQAGSVAMPPGAIEGGRIAEPGAIATALRGLLDRMNVSTRDAVLGIAASSVVTRILDIPNVPDNEARTVIEGELAHYQILRDNTGAFDYIRLLKQEEGQEALPQALVMAAEESVVGGYRTVADMAGLHLVALEPSLLAMYRAAYPQMHSQGIGVCLAIGKSEAEITITSQGRIRLYRRVDIGRDTLITEKVSPSLGGYREDLANSARIPFGELEEEETSAPATAEQTRSLNTSAASNLTIELQRSLDYYASQNPDEGNISRIVLATTAPELAPLASWLSQAISIETTLAFIPPASVKNPALSSKMTPPEGLRYLGAAGLGMRELAGLPVLVPRFDLSSQQQKEQGEKTVQRRMRISMTSSIAALAIGSLLAISVGLKANTVNYALSHKSDELTAKRKVKQQVVTDTQARKDLLRALKQEGFPFPRIMDAVTDSVADQVGLTSVTLEPGGRLVITGDAPNEKDVIQTLENLKKSRYFDSAAMDSFDRLAPMINHAPLVRFTLACQLAGVRPPAPTAH